MNKRKIAGCLGLVFSFMLSALLTQTTKALSEEKMSKFDNYQVYFYDPDALNCIPRSSIPGADTGGGGTGGQGDLMLSGSSSSEKVWNYIVGLGISGLSDRAEAIAGVLGNMSVESGFNPFIQNSIGCTGIIQWCRGSWNDGFFSYMRNKGFSDYFGTSSASASVINDGILAELDFLFKDGSGGVTAANYIARLDAPENKSGVSGARAYSDLFLVTVENAFGGGGFLEDAGVISIAGHSTYQAAEARRAKAEYFYTLYVGNVSGPIEEDDEIEDTGGYDDDEMEYCEEEESDEDEEDGETETPEAGNLADFVKKWAWPNYEKNKTERMPAYANYIDTQATYKGDCNGVDCGAFVANIMRASGWAPNYPQGSTSTQSAWLSKNWKSVSTSSLRLGDVGIKTGHVILYVGDISGFNSKTASASQCDRAPMAGSSGENLNNYTWYRKP